MSKSLHRAVLCVLCVCAIVSMPRAAAAQNLLLNPHFDTSLSSWTGDVLAVTFDAANDAGGSPASGSAQQALTFPTAQTELQQCVGVTPGTSYDFGGQIRVTQIPPGGSIGVAVAFLSGACGGAPLSSAATTLLTATGPFTAVTGTAVAPPLSISARVVGAFAGTGNLTANFDDMFFQPSAAVPAMPTVMFIATVAATLGLGGMMVAVRRRARNRTTASF